jgi:hypothetical protein
MRVIPLLSADDTRVFVWTTLELSLNRQFEKYRENEMIKDKMINAKRFVSQLENEALRVFHTQRPDLTYRLPTAYLAAALCCGAAREARAVCAPKRRALLGKTLYSL